MSDGQYNIHDVQSSNPLIKATLPSEADIGGASQPPSGTGMLCRPRIAASTFCYKHRYMTPESRTRLSNHHKSNLIILSGPR